MVLKTLDHARDYAFGASFDPLDLKRTTVALFFTRWVTHFCAPLFVFLAGTGAFLFLSRGRTKGELKRYLAVRGAIRIAFELFYVSGMQALSPGRIVLQVLWVLGLSMILLPLLIRLPDRAFTIATAIFCRVVYPLIPWTGVMALGYLFGKVLVLERERRIRILLRTGAALALAFVALRYKKESPRAWMRTIGPAGPACAVLFLQDFPPFGDKDQQDGNTRGRAA